MLERLRVHADAGVDHRQRDELAPVALGVRGADVEPPAARHRIARVHGQVEDDLLHLRRVGDGEPEPGAEIDHELDLGADQALQHPGHLEDDHVQVDQLGAKLLPPAEGEQLPRQAGRAGRRALDLDQLRPNTVGVGVGERELRVPRDRGQQVVEVVCDSTREPPDRVELLRLTQILLEPCALGIGLDLRGDVDHHAAQQLDLAVDDLDPDEIAQPDGVAVSADHPVEQLVIHGLLDRLDAGRVRALPVVRVQPGEPEPRFVPVLDGVAEDVDRTRADEREDQ